MTRQFARGLLAAALLIGSPVVLAVSVQPQPTEEAKKPAPAVEPPTITLIAPGAADGRVELRYRPKVGAVQIMSLRTKMDMSTEMNGQAAPAMVLPGTECTMKLNVEKVDGDGSIHYSAVIADFDTFDAEGAQPMMVSAMKEQLKKMVGLSANIVVSDRGVAKSGSFTGGDPANVLMKQMLDSMNQSLTQFSSPFPVEPLGVGAKWDATSRVTLNGLTVDTVATFTVLELASDRVKLQIEQVSSAKDQEVANTMIPGVKTKLHSMSGNTKGTLLIEFAHVMTQNAELTSDSKTDMSMDYQGQKMDMKQSMTTKASISPKVTMTPAKDRAPESKPAPEKTTDEKK